MESVENSNQFRRRHSNAGVLNPNQHPFTSIVLTGFHSDQHGSPVGSELDGIVEDVEKHSLDLFRIDFEWLETGFRLQNELDAALFEARAKCVDDPLEQGFQGNLFSGAVEGREPVETGKLNKLFDSK
jgi:hypothetical protein